MDGPTITITLGGSYGRKDVERAFIDHLVSFSPRPQWWLGGTRFAAALRDGQFTRKLVRGAEAALRQNGNTDYTRVMAGLYLVEAARHDLEEDRPTMPPRTEFDPKTGTFKVFRSPGVKVVEVEQ